MKFFFFFFFFITHSFEKIAQTQRDNGECQTLQNNFFDPPHYVTDFQWGIRLQGNGGGMRPKDILRAKLLEKEAMAAGHGEEDMKTETGNHSTMTQQGNIGAEKNQGHGGQNGQGGSGGGGGNGVGGSGSGGGGSESGSTRWSKESLHSCYCFNVIHEMTTNYGLLEGVYEGEGLQKKLFLTAVSLPIKYIYIYTSLLLHIFTDFIGILFFLLFFFVVVCENTVYLTNGDVCTSQLYQYLLAKYLLFAAVALVSVMNIVIQEGAKSLGKLCVFLCVCVCILE